MRRIEKIGRFACAPNHMPDSRCHCRTSEFCSPGNSSFFAEVTLDRNPGVFPVLTCEEALDFSTRDGEGQRAWRAARGTFRCAGNFFRFDKLRRGGYKKKWGSPVAPVPDPEDSNS